MRALRTIGLSGLIGLTAFVLFSDAFLAYRLGGEFREWDLLIDDRSGLRVRYGTGSSELVQFARGVDGYPRRRPIGGSDDGGKAVVANVRDAEAFVEVWDLAANQLLFRRDVEVPVSHAVYCSASKAIYAWSRGDRDSWRLHVVTPSFVREVELPVREMAVAIPAYGCGLGGGLLIGGGENDWLMGDDTGMRWRRLEGRSMPRGSAGWIWWRKTGPGAYPAWMGGAAEGSWLYVNGGAGIAVERRTVPPGLFSNLASDRVLLLAPGGGGLRIAGVVMNPRRPMGITAVRRGLGRVVLALVARGAGV